MKSSGDYLLRVVRTNDRPPSITPWPCCSGCRHRRTKATSLRTIPQPHIRCLGTLLPGHERNGLVRASRAADAASEAPGRVDVNLGQSRGVELGPELALAHTVLASRAEIPVHLADVLRPEEVGHASLLDVAPVGQAVPVAVAEADHVRGHAGPDAVDQPFSACLIPALPLSPAPDFQIRNFPIYNALRLSFG